MPEFAKRVAWGSVVTTRTIQIAQRSRSCSEFASDSAYGALRFHLPNLLQVGRVLCLSKYQCRQVGDSSTSRWQPSLGEVNKKDRNDNRYTLSFTGFGLQPAPLTSVYAKI